MSRASVALGAVLFVAMNSFAQDNSVPSTAPADANESVASPWDFTFGPQEDGHFGTSLKGETYYPLGRTTLSQAQKVQVRTTPFQLASPWIGLEVDGGWTSKPDALNNVSMSVRPSVGLQRVFYVPGPEAGDSPMPRSNGAWLFGFLDARQRYGHFKEGDPEVLRQINQTLLGAGVELVAAPFPLWYAATGWGAKTGRLEEAPSISFTYYGVQNNSEEEGELPEGITTDTLQAKGQAALTLPFACRETEAGTNAVSNPNDIFPNQPVVNIACPWKFDVSLTASLPMEGEDTDMQYLGDVALIYETGGAVKPVVRFRSGTEHGLQYDRQLIIGVLWNLLQPQTQR